MYCERCGNPLPEGASACPVCAVRRLHAQDDRILIWVFCVFLGFYGIHRFYLGGPHVKWGVIYLLTGAFCGIGWIYDLCHLSGWIEAYERERWRP